VKIYIRYYAIEFITLFDTLHTPVDAGAGGREARHSRRHQPRASQDCNQTRCILHVLHICTLIHIYTCEVTSVFERSCIFCCKRAIILLKGSAISEGHQTKASQDCDQIRTNKIYTHT